MVAEVPPVPALITTQSGTGWRLALHLAEDAFGDVVVAAPVGGALGVGELVEVVAAGLRRQARGDLRRPRPHASTKWQRPPKRSIASTLARLVLRGITAMKGRPRSSAK